MESGLYFGSVKHARLRPVVHEFEYPLFMAFLDIEKIPELMRVSRLSSHNRWNWASFYDGDHFGDLRKPLRQRLQDDAAHHNLKLPDGQILLLTHLRYFGYNFNPVSFYYCFDRHENVQLILAEVNNTFGETQNYWLSPANQAGNSEEVLRYDFAKNFHVSPFIGMNCQYRWSFTFPGDSLVVQTNVDENGQRLFGGTLELSRRPWSAEWLRHALFHFPWVTAKTIMAIHWEAARLRFKKVPLLHHPGPAQFPAAKTRHFGASWSNK